MQESKKSLPTNTDIKLWENISNFHYSFTRFLNVRAVNDTIQDIKTYIASNKKRPAIMLMTVKNAKELLKEKGLINIIFGLHSYAKLLELKTGYNSIYLHGLWYLILSDCTKYSKLEILNEDYEQIYVGVNFDVVPNEQYYMQWGSVFNKVEIYDQNVYIVDGSIETTISI